LANGSYGNKTLTLVFLIVGSVFACFGIVYISIVVKRYLNATLEEEQNEEEAKAAAIGAALASKDSPHAYDKMEDE